MKTDTLLHPPFAFLATVTTFPELCASHAQISGPASSFSTAVFGLSLQCQSAPPQLLGGHLNPSGLVPGPESLTGVEEPQGGLSQLSAPMMDEGVHFSKAQRTRRLFYSRGSPWSGLLGSANRASTSHSWGSRVKEPPSKAV